MAYGYSYGPPGENQKAKEAEASSMEGEPRGIFLMVMMMVVVVMMIGRKYIACPPLRLLRNRNSRYWKGGHGGERREGDIWLDTGYWICIVLNQIFSSGLVSRLVLDGLG